MVPWPNHSSETQLFNQKVEVLTLAFVKDERIWEIVQIGSVIDWNDPLVILLLPSGIDARLVHLKLYNVCGNAWIYFNKICLWERLELVK